MNNTIFDYIVEEQVKYAKPIELEEGWDWNMKDHLRRSYLYLNSQFFEQNDNRELRPYKNIVLPIMNIQFRTEGFDVKDIDLYVDNPDDYYKSLLIRKYHTVWALQNSIDTFIDEMTVSYCTNGGALVRKTSKVKPEVIDLRSLAFADQTDLLNNPFAIRHEMSFSQLRKEAKDRGWGKDGADVGIETLIELVKKEDKDKVELFEVHGSLPVEWLDDEEIVGESEMDVNQVQIVAYYKKDDGKKQGVCLFRKKMPELPFKFLKRDEVKGRALGRGGVEELFEPQQWTNQDEIWGQEMLNSASKTLYSSDDQSFKTKNNLNSVKNNEVLSLQEGKSIQQLDTYPRNLAVFNDAITRWEQHAQMLGSSEGLGGDTPSSGTPFKLYEAQQLEAKGMHRYRQGQLAVFMDEIYRDWVIPHLAKEIVKEQQFMQELSLDEIQEITETILTKKTNQFKTRMVLSMQEVDDDLVALYQDTVRQDIAKQGTKRFFKILKDEMKDAPLAVMTNIVGKQKNLALLTDKVVNVLRQFIATPQIRQDPEMNKLLNVILESSGLEPMMLKPAPPQPMQQQQAGGTQPLQNLAASEEQSNE